jgi:hypothetical protein
MFSAFDCSESRARTARISASGEAYGAVAGLLVRWGNCEDPSPACTGSRSRAERIQSGPKKNTPPKWAMQSQNVLVDVTGLGLN